MLTYLPRADIARDIMSSRLRRARRALQDLRRHTGTIKATDLISVAGMLGRKPVGKRGKEPTYEFDTPYRWARALTIPYHGGHDVPVGTACSILAHLESDLEQLELQSTGEKANGASQNGSNGTSGA